MRASFLIFAITPLLAGCAAIGGNVKGNFVCNAPDGICAPTSAIDDQAVASMGIQSESNAAFAAPAARMHSASALKIVLPARQDRFGRWRDQAVVYAEFDVVPQNSVSTSANDKAVKSRLSIAELASGAPALDAMPNVITSVADGSDAKPGDGPVDRIRADVERRLKTSSNASTLVSQDDNQSVARAATNTPAGQAANSGISGASPNVAAPSFPEAPLDDQR